MTKKILFLALSLLTGPMIQARWNSKLNNLLDHATALLVGASIANGLSGGEYAHHFLKAALAAQLIQPCIDGITEKKITADTTPALLSGMFFYAATQAKKAEASILLGLGFWSGSWALSKKHIYEISLATYLAGSLLIMNGIIEAQADGKL